MWSLWILGVLAVWLVVALAAAVILGRGIRLADERTPGTGEATPLTTADLPSGFTAAPARAPAAARRGWVPLPPVGVALVVLVLALETNGFLSRLTGASGTVAEVLSMDAPYSVPRLVVAALFAVAAAVAVAGASAQRGRRTWWLGVAAVAAGISLVKAGSTVHAEAVVAVSGVIGAALATALGALLAAAVVGGLFFLSRGERRDRRRVLGTLAGYAVAVVGLSAVSGWAAGALGSNWAAAATFVEESGEALAGVAFLMAVTLGVAPHLVLPPSWTLRRRADAEALAAAPNRPAAASRRLGT